MNETDDAVLEFYAELEESADFRISLPPTAVWYNLVEKMAVLDRSKNTVSRRMNKLDSMGLLEKIDEERGYYSLTDKGLDYLAGDLDAEDLHLDEE